MTTNRYYSFAQEGTTAQIDIYGDITSWPWDESDVSAYNLSKQLAEMNGVDTIEVNINSYGGEVAEGLAIYNALKRHNAKVITRCDGFACSIASVIFSAGDERIMHDASLLMIHNAWTYASGNAADLRKQADDLETITQASKNAYMANVNISEDELTAIMDAESWIAPADAVEMGFATSIESFGTKAPSQNARMAIFNLVTSAKDVDPSEPNPTEPNQTKPAASLESKVDAVAEEEAPPADDEAKEPGGEETPPGEQKEEAAGMAAFFMQLNNFLGGKINANDD